MKRRNPEQALQRAIVKELRFALPSGWIVQSTANKPRSKIAGAIEKSMGAIAGWPDLTVWGVVGPQPYLRADHEVHGPQRASVWFLEVKSAKGRLSPEQREVHDRLLDLGFNVEVVRSLDDALSIARYWNLPLRATISGRAA